jgi:hypothetical protein
MRRFYALWWIRARQAFRATARFNDWQWASGNPLRALFRLCVWCGRMDYRIRHLQRIVGCGNSFRRNLAFVVRPVSLAFEFYHFKKEQPVNTRRTYLHLILDRALRR